MITFYTQSDFDKAACNWVLEKGMTGNRSTWILPTGSTPEGMYRELCNAHIRGNTDFKNISFFNLDEYIGLPIDHPQSYHSYMHKNLYNVIKPNPEMIHIPRGWSKDTEKACIEYDTLLDLAGIPEIAVLGVGNNGHIGFNEPGTNPALRTHIQTLSPSTRKANQRFFPGEETPRQAITMGISDIMKAKRVLLLINTQAKAAIVQTAFSNKPDANYPVSWLQRHPDLTIMYLQENNK
ncbi:MAG: glucosamine-6-phosphate deaminase [Christensenellales bacterium]|jgi:glucosamine-6-phosphate deaminase